MTVTQYVWDQDNILYETDGNDAVNAEYTYSPEQYGELISEYRGATTYTHYYDAQGSTLAMTDDTGHVTDRFTYSAWGEEVARTGTADTPWQSFGMRGYYFDAKLRIAWVRRRPLAPAVARWSSPDPRWPNAGVNRYSYADNAPTDKGDPSGEIAVELTHVRRAKCVGVTHYWRFRLSKPAPCDGYLVQHVKKVGAAKKYNSKCTCVVTASESDKNKSEYYEHFGLIQEGYTESPFEEELADRTVNKSFVTTDQWTTDFDPKGDQCGGHVIIAELKFFCSKKSPKAPNATEIGVLPWKPGDVPAAGDLPASLSAQFWGKPAIESHSPIGRYWFFNCCCSGKIDYVFVLGDYSGETK